MERRKKLSEITRAEWIALQWVEDTQLGDEDRIFVSFSLRTPEEASMARDDWDSTAEEREQFK